MKNTIETVISSLQSIYANNVLKVQDENGKLKKSAKCEQYSAYMRSQAKTVMGITDYTCVYEFFKRNFLRAGDYDYIIVKARRAYMLARIFGIILLYENKGHNDDKYLKALAKLHSDVFIYTQEFKEHKHKKLLVLDDIVIHGRALNELVAYLTDNNLYTLDSIVMSANAECLKYNLRELFSENVQRVDNATWKRLSNEIVSLIQVSGQSYAAFTDSYLCDNNFTPANLFDYSVYSVENNARRVAGVNMDVCFDALRNDYTKGWYCTRIYTNNNEDAVIKKIAVPFVNLPLMPINTWMNYCRKYDLFNKVQYINSNNVYNNFKTAEVVYKYVSNVASALYACNMQFRQSTTNNLFGSFGVKEIDVNSVSNVQRMLQCMDAERKSENTLMWLITHEKQYNDKGTELDSANLLYEVEYLCTLKSVSLWDDVLQSCADELTRTKESITVQMLQKALDTYLDKLHMLNEKNAKKKLPRLQGIPVYALFTVLKNAALTYNWNLRMSDYNEFCAYLLSVWDVGIASYNVDVFNFKQQTYIGGCITDGEQAYHARMEQNSAMEVYALHLLKYNTANDSDFHKKIGELERKITKSADDSKLDIERLRKVTAYYDENQSLQELYSMYPATPKQQEIVRTYVRGLY